MKVFGDHARCILYIKLSYWWIGQLNYRKTMHMRKNLGDLKRSPRFFSLACCFINKSPNIAGGHVSCRMVWYVPVLYVLVPHNFAAAVDIIHRLLCCS